tara:strand:- start:364 stop:1065 length:702 start_codon:yes stop_codon:yes gene_type:complete
MKEMIINNVKISASIMCIDWLNAGDQLKILQEENIDYLHWDILDGVFAPDYILGSSIINQFRKVSNIPSDYHMMIEEPSRLFDTFEFSAKDTVTIHQECSKNLHRDLIKLRNKGVKVGVALCPATPLQTLDYIIEDIDQIIIMTVNPGYSGQPLVPQTIRKIYDMKKIIIDAKLDIQLSVDGNVSFENIPYMLDAGADILVGGTSSLFNKNMSLKNNINSIKTLIKDIKGNEI